MVRLKFLSILTLFFLLIACKKEYSVVTPDDKVALQSNFMDSVNYYTNQIDSIYYGTAMVHTITIECSNGTFTGYQKNYTDTIRFNVLNKDSVLPIYSNITEPFNKVLRLYEIDSLNGVLRYGWSNNALYGCLYNNRKILEYYYLRDSVVYTQQGKPVCYANPANLVLPCSDGYLKIFSSN